MKFITNYKELRSKGTENLCDHIKKEPNKNKNAILDYLTNGMDDGVRCASIYDYVKDEPLLGETIKLFTDGEWYWDSAEIYHFEKYYIELNKDFLKKFEE